MHLTPEEQDLLAGKAGRAARKAMEILVALGSIYGAGHTVPVASVQIAGVSFDNLGEAGLQFLTEMADGGGRVRPLTTLNPAGMDVENWPALGISAGFAGDQRRVIAAFARMGVLTTCTCTPYLVGNQPRQGEHIAWAESSAVCYANSVLGARTNREGGPSALAAALTGRTPAYGYHLDENRRPAVAVRVEAPVEGTQAFGALGAAVGRWLEASGTRPVAYLRGIRQASLEELKSLCASLATYGGAALFHIEGITPEAACCDPPQESLVITPADLEAAARSLDDAGPDAVDFVSLGCPHLSIDEIARIAALLQGQKVTKEFWITTARPTKEEADRLGYTRVIEASGAKFAADTCCVVAPIRGRFRALATDSAKACYYAASKHGFKTRFLPFDEVVREACRAQAGPPAGEVGRGAKAGRGRRIAGRPAAGGRKGTALGPGGPALPLRPDGLKKSPALSLQGRAISPGRAEGEALVTAMNVSFFGGVDPETGVVVERGHELEGQTIAGRILVFPTGKGSTVGSYTLYRLKAAGCAPAAILNAECETITAVGCIIAEIPCIDRVPLSRLETGQMLRVDAVAGTVETLYPDSPASRR